MKWNWKFNTKGEDPNMVEVGEAPTGCHSEKVYDTDGIVAYQG